MRIWIIGAGRFGRLAVKRIRDRFGEIHITIVDQDPGVMDLTGVTPICEEGVGWLHRMLDEHAPVDIIAPVIPIHLAAAWLKQKLAPFGEVQAVPVEDAWLEKLPNPMRGETGQVFVSNADFLCPDNCPEPKDRCTHTGKPRSMDLFRRLEQLDSNDTLPIVLRSHQLVPGIGGIYPKDLYAALRTAVQHPNRPLMICTACRCHGVVDIIRLRKPTPAA
jgi:hypothetical protein